MSLHESLSFFFLLLSSFGNQRIQPNIYTQSFSRRKNNLFIITSQSPLLLKKQTYFNFEHLETVTDTEEVLSACSLATSRIRGCDTGPVSVQASQVQGKLSYLNVTLLLKICISSKLESGTKDRQQTLALLILGHTQGLCLEETPTDPFMLPLIDKL